MIVSSIDIPRSIRSCRKSPITSPWAGLHLLADDHGDRLPEAGRLERAGDLVVVGDRDRAEALRDAVVEQRRRVGRAVVGVARVHVQVGQDRRAVVERRPRVHPAALAEAGVDLLEPRARPPRSCARRRPPGSGPAISSRSAAVLEEARRGRGGERRLIGGVPEARARAARAPRRAAPRRPRSRTPAPPTRGRRRRPGAATNTSASRSAAARSAVSLGLRTCTRPRAAAGTYGRIGRRVCRLQTSTSSRPGVAATSFTSARRAGRPSLDHSAAICVPVFRPGLELLRDPGRDDRVLAGVDLARPRPPPGPTSR